MVLLYLPFQKATYRVGIRVQNIYFYYVCRAMHGHTYSKSMDQPDKVANPARGQLNSENGYFPVAVRA